MNLNVPRKTFASAAAPTPMGRVELAYIMFALSILSGALAATVRFARGDDVLPPGQTELANTVSQAIILSGILIYYSRHWRILLKHARALLPYLLILGLCMLSVSWSVYPFLTARRCATLSTCVFFSVYCHERLGLDGMIRLLAKTTLILALMSIFVFFAIPRIGHESAKGYTDAMRGVFAQKNSMAESMVLATSCYGYMILKTRRFAAGPILAILVLTACILLAKSATSLLIGTIVVGLTTIFYFARTRWNLLIVFGVTATLAAVIFVAVASPETLFDLLGRDSSFTGRVPLWQMSIAAALQRPLLGYGYSAFWNENSRVVQYIWIAVDWEAPSAHNGYIDIALQIGVLGLALYAWTWTSVIATAIRAYRKGTMPAAVWVLLFMTINLLLNLDEGPLPYPDQFTAMMPATMIALAAWRRSEPRQTALRDDGRLRGIIRKGALATATRSSANA
jgi:O-antigen ligase